ncbi:MAG: hypothetical protein ACLSVD_01995 [Eggerthellaceae bacterium]
METANTLTVQQRTALLDTLSALRATSAFIRVSPGRTCGEAGSGRRQAALALRDGETGGQPDVVAYDHAADAYVF